MSHRNSCPAPWNMAFQAVMKSLFSGAICEALEQADRQTRRGRTNKNKLCCGEAPITEIVMTRMLIVIVFVVLGAGSVYLSTVRANASPGITPHIHPVAGIGDVFRH
ncbi:MAG: hypothetical protein ACWA7D_20700 [Pseudomonas asiatica]|uniref:Uncharacterized protein n=2 Tax=Pseudomonas TaxID=286 RepID=A0ABY9SUY5_9PSED|nr:MULTISPECIES: hypothetical protein [Pseudomonas]MCO8260025.1 hypothetical protein [Pseudomonas asiatica]WMY87406.1 hypothetical protein QR297_11360 [Pseudomonas shirazica]